MNQLQVTIGSAARDALCAAFDAAHATIDAEFYSISDPSVIASLNRAAQRHVDVRIHVEGNPARYRHKTQTDRVDDRAPDPAVVESLRREFSSAVGIIVENHPDVLVHGKTAVVDGSTAYISTANPTHCGFASPGEILIVDSRSGDVAAVQASIDEEAASSAGCVVTGPGAMVRSRIDQLLGATSDLRVATEDLSDSAIIGQLEAREAAGHHDRVLIEANGRVSRSEKQAVRRLRSAGVEVRSLAKSYMHEKYVDSGDEIYVGSANLTRNGLDEAREIGIVAPANDFGMGSAALRADFDANWKRAATVIA
jgi:phosphatidylserine/phosphatidylglycerophosphate/cardiolipin synthase-like enzyme